MRSSQGSSFGGYLLTWRMATRWKTTPFALASSRLSVTRRRATRQITIPSPFGGLFFHLENGYKMRNDLD